MSEHVPIGWEIKALSELGDYANGRAFKPKDWSTSGLPIIRIAQINVPLSASDCYEGNDLSEKHIVRCGDLLFSWSATLKALIWKNYEGVLNQHIFKVTEKRGVSRLYLQQLLDFSMDKLAEHSHGSTMKHIKKGVLDEFFVAIPKLPEQQKIASILTSVDEVIEKTQLQINKLQDLKKATMNEFLTKGIGHTEFKDSELGRMPKSWEVRDLIDCIEKLIDCEHKTAPKIEYSKYYVVCTNAVRNGNLLVDQLYCTNESSYREWTSRETPTHGDILLTREAPAGEICLVPEKINVCLGQRMVLVRPDLHTVLPDYLCVYLQTDVGVQAIQKYSIGTTVSRINMQDIKKVKVIVPPISEQHKIYKAVNLIENSIKLNIDKVLSATKIKKALMGSLLTGKVRV